VQFAKAAEGALVVERALHGSFFKQYGITPRAFAQTPLSPACHHYISYLLATAYADPYEVLLGALLPCFWIYAVDGAKPRLISDDADRQDRQGAIAPKCHAGGWLIHVAAGWGSHVKLQN
jgi:thiaminase